MNKMKVFLLVFLLLIFSCLLLSGCQKNPQDSVVISKNDGHFDTNAIISATTSNPPNATQEINQSKTFFSTDGTVEFKLDLSDTLTAANMPILEVVPHYLTGTDAKKIANALFGDNTFWEWQHWSDEVLSRSEIQEKIIRWSEFTSQEALDSLWGYPQVDSVPVVKKFIEEYTMKLETAQDQNNKVPCEWEFKKAPYYLFSANEAASYGDMENEDDMIKATVSVDGVPFTLQVGSRNKNDYKSNYIRAYIDSDSPLGIDRRYFTAQLCRTERPTPDQVEHTVLRAQQILDEMELGHWVVDRYEVVEHLYNDEAEYIIEVCAVPVLAGISTIYQAPISNLTEPDVYASNYQMSNVQFQFSPQGQLIYFSMDSPIDIEKTINNNVAVISTDELLDLAETNLKHSSFSQYDVQMQTNPESKNIRCVVNIRKAKYALARIRVPDTDANYYYVPSLSLYGDAEFYNKTTDDFYFSYQDMTFLSLNAIDGTIINSTNS